MLVEKYHSDHGPRRSLVLAGGGMRLAYQAGVLLALEEAGLKFQHVDGTSGGIFNAAMLASNLDPVDIAERWRTLKVKDFVSMRKLGSYFSPLYMQGYTDADNIRDKVFPHLGIDLATINNNEDVVATFNVCNFSDKSIEAIPNQTVQLNHLLAGVSLPIVMPAQKIDGKWYSDAVWIKDANVLEAVNREAEEVWLVWAIGNCKDYLPGALNQYVHMIEMSANGALLEDYEQIRLRSKSGEAPTDIILKVIKPEFPLPLDPDLFFGKIDTRSLINMGYADTKDCLGSLPEQGVPMNAEATRMSDPGTRLCIRGLYEGQLNWNGETVDTKLYTYLRISDLKEGLKLTLYGSLWTQTSNKEIPLYDTHLNISEESDERHLKMTGQFIANLEIYQLNAHCLLDSPIDILLGIGFKSIYIEITRKDGPEESIASGHLYQPITNRLKSIIQTNLRTEEGKPGGFRKKYTLLSKLASYEI